MILIEVVILLSGATRFIGRWQMRLIRINGNDGFKNVNETVFYNWSDPKKPRLIDKILL